MKVKAFFQKIRENWIVSAVLTVLAGLVLTVFPGQTLKVISYVMGSAAVILGTPSFEAQPDRENATRSARTVILIPIFLPRLLIENPSSFCYRSAASRPKI